MRKKQSHIKLEGANAAKVPKNGKPMLKVKASAGIANRYVASIG